MGRLLHRLALLALPFAQAACGLVGPAADIAGETPNMPECAQAGRFSFAGRATLAELGLDEFVTGPEAGRPALIWVTADPIRIGPPGGPPMPGEPPPQRAVCVQWPDGSGMMGPAPAGWQPPGGLADDPGPTDGMPPVLPLLLAAVAIAGASFLAFRRAER